jgi:hypothetical protein
MFIVIAATSELTFNYDDFRGISHHHYHHHPFQVLGTLKYYKMESFHHFRHLKTFPPFSSSGTLPGLFNLLFSVSSVLFCKFCYLWELQCSHDLCYGPEGCTQQFSS